MGRFLLFAGEQYYPSGGMNDLQGRYATIREAQDAYGGDSDFGSDFGQIYDTLTNEVALYWQPPSEGPFGWREPESDGTINLDTIVDLIVAAGVTAHVEQTGGGCATIFAGQQRPDKNDPDWQRWDVAAGPGRFLGPGWTNARSNRGDFTWGPDDAGESGFYVVDDETEQQIAEMIIAAIQELGSTDRLVTVPEQPNRART